METLASSHTEEEALRSSKPHSVSPFLRFLFCDVVFGIHPNTDESSDTRGECYKIASPARTTS